MKDTNGKTKEDIIAQLKDIVKQKGLKYTKQREIIFETILDSDKHLNAEEVYNSIREKHPDINIGIATVYRALVFLEEADLISSISLNQDGKKFETNFKNHHDHLICVKCGKIVEFHDDEIEQRQEIAAVVNGFKLVSHTMNLYGVCKDCQDKAK
jgi:Fur family ferric uptake transcriptional regulator